MTRQLGVLWALAAAIAIPSRAAAAAFDLQYTINSSGFTANQLQLLTTAVADAERLWESKITGYQPGITVSSLPITVSADASQGLALAGYTSAVYQGGFTVATGGYILINPNQIEPFANWSPAFPTSGGKTGHNCVDELIAHETGHVLGIGILWGANTGYVAGSFQYTGQYGLAAYRAEFDANAAFIPVENAGTAASKDLHWNQLFRSQEGGSGDPWLKSPLLGITDPAGRDLGLELMTAAIDPDYGEPFLSNTTVQSLRDLGYTVVPEPSAWLLLAVAVLTWWTCKRPYSSRSARGKASRGA
jgi:hypothetical protein